MVWFLGLLLIVIGLTAGLIIYQAHRSQDFWYGQAYYWRERSRQEAKKRGQDMIWRASYERALALPVQSDQQCLDDLWARAYQGDRLAEAILCEKLAIDVQLAPKKKI